MTLLLVLSAPTFLACLACIVGYTIQTIHPKLDSAEPIN